MRVSALIRWTVVTKSLATLLILSIGSLAELKNCSRSGSPSPTESYEAFAQHATDQNCEALYAGLDRMSQARLAAGLETMASLAHAVRTHAEQNDHPEAREVPEAAEGTEANQDVEATDAAPGGNQTEAQAGAVNPASLVEGLDGDALAGQEGADSKQVEGDEEGEEAGDERERLKNKLLERYRKKHAENEKKGTSKALAELKGKALFVAMCAENRPNFGSLFRERGPATFVAQNISSEKVKGKRATLKIGGKGSKGKKSRGSPPIAMVLEDSKWKVVLDDLKVRWERQDDGRWLPVLDTPILAIAVETDLSQTPTRSYERIREHVLRKNCKAFYGSIESESKARLERFLPMVIGLAKALGPRRDVPTSPDGENLLLSLCRSASRGSNHFAGVKFGTVEKEEINGRIATLTLQSKRRVKGKRVAPKVTMVREGGRWKLSLDSFEQSTFAAPAPPDSKRRPSSGDDAEPNEASTPEPAGGTAGTGEAAQKAPAEATRETKGPDTEDK